MRPHPLLLPLAFVYGAGVQVRNMLYDSGLRAVRRVGVPVISVGNISTGGTGKTPFVSMLVRYLLGRGRRPAIVSRGYGRKSKGTVVVSDGTIRTSNVLLSGDEPLELASMLTGVPVIVDEDRLRGATHATEAMGADVVVLDDGFQHRSLSRDLDIVLVTAAEVMGTRFLLPAGHFREPLAAMKRSNLIVISQCSGIDDFEHSRKHIGQVGTIPVIGSRTIVNGLRDIRTNDRVPLGWIRRKRVLGVSGIARPDRFDQSVRDLGAEAVSILRFADHHWYTARDLDTIRQNAENANVDIVVTTMKDAARLTPLLSSLNVPAHIAVLGIEITSEFLSGADAFDALVAHAVAARAA